MNRDDPLDSAFCLAALDLAARGHRVFPLIPNTKTPAISKWPELASSDPDQIIAWWTRWPDANIGVACGRGLLGLDVDVKNRAQGLRSLIDLDLPIDALVTFTVRTPTGGWHYYFQGPDVGNSAGRLGDGLDVRSEGGYLVGPGSVIDGRRYVIVKEAPMQDAPAELIARLTARRERCDDTKTPVVELDQPDAIARSRTHLEEGAPVAIEGSGGHDTTYRTACRLKDFGVSEAMALDLMLECWNERCLPPWPPDDLAVKVGDAYRYGQNPPGSAHPAAAFDGVRVDGAIGANGAIGTWEKPDLSVLDGPQILPPPFPKDVLGAAWADWCQTVARGANAPFDYSAAGLLTIAAALIGNARVAQAGPTWSEPSILWTSLVGPPSSGKSPSQNELNAIVSSMEAELARQFKARLRQHEAATEQARRRKKAWREGLEAQGADVNVAEPPPDSIPPKAPVRPRIAVTDATIEVVAEISAGNPKGVILIWDELAGWYRGFNRYRGKSGGEEQFWLQAYGARRYAVDRKSNPEPIIVPRLSVSVLGGVQPDLVAGLLDREADGLVARFLFVYPAPEPHFSLPTEPVDRKRAKAALSRLWALAPRLGAHGEAEPIACRLTEPAAAIFEAWWSGTRARAAEDSGALGEWLGKAGGLALRFALVLEHLWWISDSLSPDANSANSANSSLFDTGPVELTVAAIETAIRLVDEWAAPMTRRTFGVAAASPREREAATLGLWLRRNCVHSFNARDVRRSGSGPGGRLSNAAVMDAACDALVVAGIIRPVGVRSGDQPGRAPKDFEINPALLTSDRRATPSNH